MNEPIIIELEGPPIAWARTRVNTGGRRARFFTPKEQRSYALSLQYAAKEAMRGRSLLTGPVALNVTARLPIPTSWPRNKKRNAAAGVIRPTGKPDYDNFAKLAGDALNAIVYCDDAQICDGRVRKLYAEEPGLVVEVSAMEASQ